MTTRFSFPLVAAAAVIIAAPLSAQLLPPIGGGSGGGLGGVVGGVTRTVGGVTEPVLGDSESASNVQRQVLTSGGFNRVADLASSVAGSAESLLDLRKLRLSLLIDANRGELDRDGGGNPVRRDRLVAIEPDPASLAAAARAGFRVITDQREPDLGLRLVTLTVPARMNARQALDRLRRAAPDLDADYDHIFEPAGGALVPATAALAVGAAGVTPAGTRAG